MAGGKNGALCPDKVVNVRLANSDRATRRPLAEGVLPVFFGELSGGIDNAFSEEFCDCRNDPRAADADGQRFPYGVNFRFAGFVNYHALNCADARAGAVLYAAAFKQASDDERAIAGDLLVKWMNGRRD